MRYWEIQESLKQLDEVKMSPTALLQFAKSPLAQGMKIGFEIETIFSGVSSNIDFDDDYSKDVPIESLEQVRDFFTSGSEDSMSHYNDDELVDEFVDWVNEAYDEYIDKQVEKDIEYELYRAYKLHLSSYYGQSKAARMADLNVENNDNDFIDWKGQNEESVREDLRSSKEQETSLGEVYQIMWGKNGATMSALAREANSNFIHINWPYFREIPGSMDGAYDFYAAESIGEDMQNYMGVEVEVSESYHQVSSGSGRDPSKWFIEPDASIQPEKAYDMGVEIISPPMPLNVGIEKLQQIFKFLDEEETYTNDSTGFHVGVSLPSQSTEDVDFIKLALFLGDEYVLNQFGRLSNDYARSALGYISDMLAGKTHKKDFDYPNYVAKIMDNMRNGLMNKAADLVSYVTNHDISINMKKDYIEFRSAGGQDYTIDVNSIIATMLRYARAMAIAADPEAEKQEYAKKLYKLINPQFKRSNLFSDDSMDAFVRYQAGDLSIEQLVSNLRIIQARRNANKPKQEEPTIDQTIEEHWRNFVSNDTTQIDEDWRQWVAGMGAASALAGVGSAALDAYNKEPVKEPTAQVQVQKAPTQKQEPLVSQQHVELAKELLSTAPAKILIKSATQAGIKGAELTQFLAQTAHESANFTTTKEFGDKKYFRKYDIKYNPAKAKELGNLKPGDGERYKGRGYIQLTGRYNYKKAGEALGIPLEKHPELAEKPEIAAKIAVWFWTNRVQPNVSNFSDTPQATKPINPGMKGLQDRQTKFHSMKQVMVNPNLTQVAKAAPKIVPSTTKPKNSATVATKQNLKKGNKS